MNEKENTSLFYINLCLRVFIFVERLEMFVAAVLRSDARNRLFL